MYMSAGTCNDPSLLHAKWSFSFFHSVFHSSKSTPLKKLSENINTLSNNSPQKAWISRWFPIPCTQQGIVLRLNVCEGGWRGASVSTDTPIQQNSKPPASVQSLWSVGKPRRVAERRSTSPESPDGLIWERREIHGTSPGFLAERLPYLVMDWGRRERSSQGWIRLNLYPGHMCVHDNMVAFFLCRVILRQLPG